MVNPQQILKQLPPEVQQQFFALPDQKKPEMLMVPNDLMVKKRADGLLNDFMDRQQAAKINGLNPDSVVLE